jgi:hypothetical protein
MMRFLQARFLRPVLRRLPQYICISSSNSVFLQQQRIPPVVILADEGLEVKSVF